MFCGNCGSQIADNEQFCRQCGAPVATEPVATEPVATEPVATEPVVTEPVATEPVVTEPAATEPVATEPVVTEPIADEQQYVNYAQPEPQVSASVQKPKKFGFVAAIVAVVLAAAIAVGAFMGPLKGTAVKAFGSDEKYFAYVVEERTDSAASEISDAYGSYIEKLKGSTGADLSVALTVGDKAKSTVEDLLEDSAGVSMDLDWFDSVCMDMDVNLVEKALQLGADLKLNDKSLLDADAILDMDKGEFFVGVLSLNDKYLKGEMDMAEASAMMDEIPVDEIKKILPSEDVIEKLLNKYIAIACDQIDDVEKSKETIKVDDVEQKVTALEIKFNQKLLMNVGIAILEAAKDDKDLKNVIMDVAKYLEDRGEIDRADEVYDSFQESISDALDSAEALDADTDTIAKITVYVDNSHDVVGCKVKADGMETISCVTARDGAKFATEVKLPGVEIKGAGTEKRDVINGEFTVKAQDMKVCELTLTDFTTKDDLLNGKIRIAPSSDLLEMSGMGSVGASAFSLANFELELDFTSKKDTTTVGINLLSGDELFVGVTVAVKETKVDKIKTPTENVLDVEDADEWLESLDLDKFIDNLEKAGVPSELLDMIEESASVIG